MPNATTLYSFIYLLFCYMVGTKCFATTMLYSNTFFLMTTKITVHAIQKQHMLYNNFQARAATKTDPREGWSH